MIGDLYDVFLADQADPIRVTVEGRDLRRWEAETGRSAIEDNTYTGYVQRAHLAAVRQGLWPGDKAARDEWMARELQTVRVRDEEPVDPTRPARGADPSSTSP